MISEVQGGRTSRLNPLGHRVLVQGAGCHIPQHGGRLCAPIMQMGQSRLQEGHVLAHGLLLPAALGVTLTLSVPCPGLLRAHWPCHRQLHMGHLLVWVCHPDVDGEKRGPVGWGGGDGESGAPGHLTVPIQLPVMLLAMYLYTVL